MEIEIKSIFGIIDEWAGSWEFKNINYSGFWGYLGICTVNMSNKSAAYIIIAGAFSISFTSIYGMI